MSTFMVLKEFVNSNYSFEKSLEDHSTIILNELFKGLQLQEAGNDAGDEMDAGDDNDDLILMIDESDNQDQDEPELL